MMSYADYHRLSIDAKDVDPSYPMLLYVCDRFELNTEQRYWLAFLYAATYCAPAVFYIYNEFPDFENVDLGRLERWWTANRERLVFQTDRRWVRSRNQFCDMVRSYQKFCGGLKQRQAFELYKTGNEFATYNAVDHAMKGVFQMGRFSRFLWTEAVHVVTGFPMRPQSMDLLGSDNDSCRGGMAYQMGFPEFGQTKGPIPRPVTQKIQAEFDRLAKEWHRENHQNTVWAMETTLCAYRKYRVGKRFIGYYVHRQGREIAQMQANVPEGVDWSVLWDFRRETYAAGALLENSVGHDPKNWKIQEEVA